MSMCQESEAGETKVRAGGGKGLDHTASFLKGAGSVQIVQNTDKKCLYVKNRAREAGGFREERGSLLVERGTKEESEAGETKVRAGGGRNKGKSRRREKQR